MAVVRARQGAAHTSRTTTTVVAGALEPFRMQFGKLANPLAFLTSRRSALAVAIISLTAVAMPSTLVATIAKPSTTAITRATSPSFSQISSHQLVFVAVAIPVAWLAASAWAAGWSRRPGPWTDREGNRAAVAVVGSIEAVAGTGAAPKAARVGGAAVGLER